MSPPGMRTENPHSNRRDWQNLTRLLPYIWSYRGRVALALGCLIAGKLATVAVPLVLKHIIDARKPIFYPDSFCRLPERPNYS